MDVLFYNRSEIYTSKPYAITEYHKIAAVVSLFFSFLNMYWSDKYT